LDFSTTIFAFHLIACTVYDGFPMHVAWWVTQVVCTAVMVLSSEYLCIHGDMVASIDISIVGVSPKQMK
jgi:hypothetical protein